MNVKKVWGYVAAFVCGVVSAIIGAILHNHRKSDAGTENAVDELSDTTRSLRDNNQRFEELIERIEKQRVEN